MHMAVDQPGHQCAPTTVDDAGLCELDRFGRDLPDRVAFDDQFVAAVQFPGLGIEHFEILEMVDVHVTLPDRSRLELKCPTAVLRRPWVNAGAAFDGEAR